MTAVDLATYAWLSESELEVAGCVTVIPGADPDAVARAFGHDPADEAGDPGEERFADRSAVGELGDHGSEIWVAASPAATTVFEFNGFEGARDEVLREASRVVPAKTAASLFWNVNGAVQVTCARRGKVVASVDLSYVDEDDLAEVPRALRRLAQLCMGDDHDADLLAVGAAMVETYAGVGFTRADLDDSRVRHIVSRPSDLSTYAPGGRTYGPLDHALPGAQAAIDSLSPHALRRLAEWAALAAVREAGLTDDPAVRTVLDQLGSGVATSIPPGFEALRRRAAAESQRQSRLVEETDDETSFGAIAQYHAWLPGHALESLRYTSHADAYSAAVGALMSAATAFSCTRLDRGAWFVENTNGRRRESLDPSPRSVAFVEVVGQVLAADPAQWDDLAGLLPAPLTAAELAAAADVDRRLQEAGAFDTWQVMGGWSPEDRGDDDELVVVVDREAEVMERYRALERRDRAIAARGPIDVEVLTPANPGGFAIALSDGLRIERLPAGQVAGSLWLTFVFSSEFGPEAWRSRDARSSPDSRVTYSGPDGRIHVGGSGGGSDQSVYYWHVRIEAAGRPWVRVDYLDGGKSVASERFEFA